MQVNLILIALIILIPMPAAGGLPVLLAAVGCLAAVALKRHLDMSVLLTHRLILLLGLALLMVGWESLATLFHYTPRDLELLAVRGVWTILGFAYLTLLAGDSAQHTAQNLAKVLFLGCTALVVAMVLESTFYPTYEFGRQLGTLNIPWPRATGVPQSDGKIGVYACICVVFFTVAFVRTQRKTMLLGAALACTTLVFTQSRSSALGMIMTLGFLYLYYLVTTRSVIFKVIAAVAGSVILVLMLFNFQQIYSTVKGEGVFEANVDARSMGTDYALEVVAEHPLFGAGGESLKVEGMQDLEVHNTFLGLSIKSGMPTTVIFLAFLLFSCLAVWERRAGILPNCFLTAALLSGPLIEHNLYPGYLNEHLWLIAPVAIAVHYFQYDYQPSKTAVQHSQAHRGQAGSSANGRNLAAKTTPSAGRTLGT